MYELIGYGAHFIIDNILSELEKERLREIRKKKLQQLRDIIQKDESGDIERVIQKHFRLNFIRDFFQVYLYYFLEAFPYLMLLVFGIYIFSRRENE